MMNTFGEFVKELPPFQEYLDLLYKKKQMKVIARKSGSAVVQYAMLWKQLFWPSRKTNRETSKRVKDLAKTAADAIITELHDPNKATLRYLSKSKSEYSWKYCTKERKAALIGKKHQMTRQRAPLVELQLKFENMGRYL